MLSMTAKSTSWMKSTRWRSQGPSLSQQQMDRLNVRMEGIKEGKIYLRFQKQPHSHCRPGGFDHVSFAPPPCVFGCFAQARAARNASTARPTLTPSAAFAPAVCAAASRMLTCSCYVMSATWRSTSTA